MVYVFLANGFEEIEALAPVDMLRRAGVDVRTVTVGEKAVSARNVEVPADIDIENIDNLDGIEMIVLPGGADGVEVLYNCGAVKKIIAHCMKNNIKIGAICAAPSILARLGYLKNIKATAHPSFRHYLTENGAIIPEEKVITDGLFTTAAGAGVSIEFALELVRVLKSGEAAEKIGEQILFY
jgi:4-methyl-5(b-hydroxyethyl)-thiazole monophosphate biosynthesis